jgi:hypothetical protein
VRTNSSVVFASLQLSCGMHHRFVTLAEAERLANRGDCKRVRLAAKKIVGRARAIYRLVPRPEPSKSSSTPCPITFDDTLANLGLVNGPGTAHYLAVKSSRLKIREYSGVNQHDPCFKSG